MDVRAIDMRAVADLSKAPPSLTLPLKGGETGGAERAAFKKAATEFESFFLFYMMKTMRQAIPKADLIRSNATDTYKGMFDQEVANLAAKRGGPGLAKALESQFFPPPLVHSSFSAALPIKVTEEEGL